MTRWSVTPKASWAGSSAPSRPASVVVVTSTPSRRSPSATACGTCSSRWKRIVLGIPFRQSGLQLRRAGLRLQFRDEAVLVLDLGRDLVRVGPVVGQGRVHLGPSQVRVLLDHLGRAQALFLDPLVNVLD